MIRSMRIVASKPSLASGTGGRSSRTGYTATVFGASGFLGNYLTSRLANRGTITVVPYREEMKKRHLKVQGDLGVVNFVEMDIRNVQSIEDSVKHSDIVFNLMGREYPTKNFSYDDIHVEGARRVAQAVAKYNVARFVHVSAFNADPNSTSEFNRTKGLGELAVREIIPDATIVRPSVMYGNGDKFLNKIASATRLFSANNNKETLRPVSVLDVAAALEKIGYDDSTVGKTYELYGPKEYTMAQIHAMVQEATQNQLLQVNLPKQVYQFIAQLTQYIYWPTISPDQVERMFINQVVDENAATFADLGIKPAQLEDLVLKTVRHWRSYLHLHDNVETDAQRKKEREYIHVIDG
ncbi:hypothetical protein D0Z00_000467 [Geotrichum galactomycetum]|uniref:Uncharacterized protein n=1 Tax=Geotrichum galactomycetum TaxID=27317 RepID=A0ACB6V9V6_9ASCO|nr:hypothetical protein D0Z00_000467 [Geotrichum candidum]